MFLGAFPRGMKLGIFLPADALHPPGAHRGRPRAPSWCSPGDTRSSRSPPAPRNAGGEERPGPLPAPGHRGGEGSERTPNELHVGRMRPGDIPHPSCHPNPCPCPLCYEEAGTTPPPRSSTPLFQEPLFFPDFPPVNAPPLLQRYPQPQAPCPGCGGGSLGVKRPQSWLGNKRSGQPQTEKSFYWYHT